MRTGANLLSDLVNAAPFRPPFKTHKRSRAMPRAHGHGRINFDSGELISGLIRNDEAALRPPWWMISQRLYGDENHRYSALHRCSDPRAEIFSRPSPDTLYRVQIISKTFIELLSSTICLRSSDSRSCVRAAVERQGLYREPPEIPVSAGFLAEYDRDAGFFH